MPSFLKELLVHAWRSTDEFKFIVLLSLMPLWLGALLQLVTKSSVIDYLNNYLSNGEALLICTATIGPLLHTIIKDDANISSTTKPFPGKSNYISLIVLVCVISAAILGLKTAIKDNSLVVISFNAIWFLSLLISIGSVILWFLISGTRSLRETGAPAMMRAAADDFTKKFQAAADD